MLVLPGLLGASIGLLAMGAFFAVHDIRVLNHNLFEALQSLIDWKEAARRAEKKLKETPAAIPSRGGNFLYPTGRGISMSALISIRRMITRVTLDRPMDIGRWVDRVSEHEDFAITAIRFISFNRTMRQSLYIAGNVATFHLPSITLGTWIKLDPIQVAPKDQAQLFRLSDWSGPEFNVEFDLDIKIASRQP